MAQMIYLPHARTKTDRSVSRSGPLLMLPEAAGRVIGPDLPSAARRAGLRRLDHLVRSCAADLRPPVRHRAEFAAQSPDRHRSEPEYRPQPPRRHDREPAVQVLPCHSAAAIVTALILAAAGTRSRNRPVTGPVPGGCHPRAPARAEPRSCPVDLESAAAAGPAFHPPAGMPDHAVVLS